MVVFDDAAVAFPAAGVVLSVAVIRVNPVRALIGRPRPVAVVPLVAASLRILVALDPQIAGAGSPTRTPKETWALAAAAGASRRAANANVLKRCLMTQS
jgi:hypothetical protein